jgi:L-asparaginase II
MLAACVTADWPTDTYLDPEHPLQVGNRHIVAEATGVAPEPSGVDGCGAPAFRGTVAGLATSFARLSIEPRFAEAARAMTRFPALVADNRRPDGRFGMWWGGPAKVGAAGILASAKSGIGIATKSRAGSIEVAVAAAIAVASRLELITPAMHDALEDEAAPPVFGGGRRVGTLAAIDT